MRRQTTQPTMRGLMAGLFLLIAAVWITYAPAARAQEGPGPLVLVLELDGAVGPGTAEYLSQGLETARERSAELVVITMDTPGGLDSSTRDIIAAMSGMEMPAVSGRPGPGEITTCVAPPRCTASTVIASLRCTSTDAPRPHSA